MSELPGITARELARDIAFQEALERYAKDHGSPETVAWCALRAIERAGGVKPSTVIDEIADERRRQIEAEGFTPEHDDQWTDGELAEAAACYAEKAGKQPAVLIGPGGFAKPIMWPWDAKSWKQKGARRDLVRAAALIVAEIERLDRAAAKGEGQAA